MGLEGAAPRAWGRLSRFRAPLFSIRDSSYGRCRSRPGGETHHRSQRARDPGPGPGSVFPPFFLKAVVGGFTRRPTTADLIAQRGANKPQPSTATQREAPPGRPLPQGVAASLRLRNGAFAQALVLRPAQLSDRTRHHILTERLAIPAGDVAIILGRAGFQRPRP